MQGSSDQNNPKENKCKKAKWLSRRTNKELKKRKEKGKGEKERYIHLNVEFQRIANRGKKAFLNDQCKKKKRKTIEWERLEISSRKLEIPRVYFI